MGPSLVEADDWLTLLLLAVLANALLVGVSGAEFSMAALLQPTTYSNKNTTSISGWGTSSEISREPYKKQGSDYPFKQI